MQGWILAVGISMNVTSIALMGFLLCVRPGRAWWKWLIIVGNMIALALDMLNLWGSRP